MARLLLEACDACHVERSSHDPDQDPPGTGLHPNTEVAFEIAGNAARIKKVRRGGRGEKLVSHLKGRGTVRMSTDEILALTRR